jgi:hypothetical protein
MAEGHRFAERPLEEVLMKRLRVRWVGAMLLAVVPALPGIAAPYGYCAITEGGCRARSDSGDVVVCVVVSDVFPYSKPRATQAEWNLWLERNFDRLLDWKDGEWVPISAKQQMAENGIQTSCPYFADKASAERERDELASKKWRTAGVDGIAVPWHPGVKGSVDKGITASRETSEHPNPPGKRWYLCHGSLYGSNDVYVTKFLGTQTTRENWKVMNSYGQQFGQYLTENKLTDAERKPPRNASYSGSCQQLAEEQEAATVMQVYFKNQHLVEMTWLPGQD